ncbi:hypothetical protein HNY73_021605 [Argiope bruennichi]|uniref:Uncharacterized protein n=1 Tax=Argiope bruennichi TaxID=94029 RepID=A0A8T0DY24_ARGBR|nr:hypothetical protein HNY73_021605 [Argiope bruennichi]
MMIYIGPCSQELDLNTDIIEGTDDGSGYFFEGAVWIYGVQKGYFHPTESEQERCDGSRYECVGRPRAGESGKQFDIGHFRVGAELEEGTDEKINNQGK